jgi:hypothetical protein
VNSITWRRLRTGECDHEMLWLAVSAAAAPLGAFWLRCGLPVPPCAFHMITGCPCPTCGVTRALRQLTHGNLMGALHFNPLIVCAAGAMLIYDAYAAAVLALQLPRLRVEQVAPQTARRLRIAVLSAIAINWLWLIYARV